MKAKDLLLVASGLAIGYLVFKKDLFKKKQGGISDVKKGAEEIVSGAGSVVSGTIDVVTGGIRNPVNTKQTDLPKKLEGIDLNEFVTT